jgi:HSP20 family molecular chaperone IbpA
MAKRSFFEKLSGSVSVGDSFDTFDDEPGQARDLTPNAKHGVHPHHTSAHPHAAPNSEGQLPVDVHQTHEEIVIRAFVAGVRPDELSISISRDMVVIEGSRMEREQVTEGDYFTRELFWGSFSRTILLPQEIDVDNSAASAKDGLLTLILPKLDKARQTKLRVKVG